MEGWVISTASIVAQSIMFVSLLVIVRVWWGVSQELDQARYNLSMYRLRARRWFARDIEDQEQVIQMRIVADEEEV